ncbi:GNAT family N-acetyltransferase [uncultured Actinomyces sp.]|uniref:GNAT family N-acetyltransferase n=1 Tax=uncultured Actinomyces sp. TaxID=249061 RepID=UPI003459CB21
MPQYLPERHSLYTKRLHLETLHENHADEMFDVLRDPSIYQYMGGRLNTAEELRQQYKRQSSNWDGRPVSWHTWIIREKQTSTAIGYIQATLNHTDRKAELAWVLSPLWTGKRYSSEATRRVMKELCDGGLVTTFTCTIDQRNAPSQHLAQSLGFTMSDPEPVDSQTWSLSLGK